MEPKLTLLDYGIIIGYLLVALIIGLLFSRRASRSAEEFFLGGRRLPWWLIGISLIATTYASDTPLAVTELVRRYGIQRMWWLWSGCIGLILGIFLFAQLWRRAALITDAQFIELRYAGRSAALLRGFKALYSGIISNLIIMAWVILAMSSVITTLTDFNNWMAIGICVLVALLYCVLSGFYGVVITDLIQFFMAMLGMTYLAVRAYGEMGGPEAVIQQVIQTAGYGPATVAMFPDLSEGFTQDLFSLLVFLLIMWWSDQGGYTMQRMSACRNEKHSVLAALLFALFNTARVWLWIPVALVSIILFPDLSRYPTKDTGAYPLIINTFLGPGMKGVLVASFLAAFMSTIDTHLNWGASYIMTDIYRRFIRPQAQEDHYMKVSRLVVVFLLVGAVGLVPFMESISGAWEFLALMNSGVGVISFCRWFWWRINAYSEIAVLTTSSLLAFLDLFLGRLYPGISLWGHPLSQIPFVVKFVLIMPISLGCCLVVTLLTEPVPKEKLEEFYLQVHPGGFWRIIDPGLRGSSGLLNKRTLFFFLCGVSLCQGFSLGIGYLLLCRPLVALCFLVLASLGAIGVVRYIRNID